MRLRTLAAFALFVLAALVRCEPAPAWAEPVTITVEDDADLPATLAGQSVIVVGAAVVTRAQARCEEAEALAASATAQAVLERDRLEAVRRENALLQEALATPEIPAKDCPAGCEAERPWWARAEFWGGVGGGIALTIIGAVSLFIVSR